MNRKKSNKYAKFFRQLYNKELSMALYDDAPGWAYATLEELKIKENSGYALFKTKNNEVIYIAVIELNRKSVVRKLRAKLWRKIHWTSRLILNYDT